MFSFKEINSLQSQLGARVNVELNAAPSVDLNRTLSEVRQEYESLMERNLREVETIFLNRVSISYSYVNIVVTGVEEVPIYV